jgi:hypothetical protein
MMTLLRLSTATAIIMFVAMVFWQTSGPRVALDVVLPPEVLRITDAGQMIQVEQGIRQVIAPHPLHWTALGFICVANSLCLFLLHREQRRRKT